MSASTSPPLRSLIDTSDHNGLRGIMAIWIVVFHALYNAETTIDIQGSSLLSMFYLLSGFSLAIGYYTKIVGEPAVKKMQSTPSESTPLISVEAMPPSNSSVPNLDSMAPKPTPTVLSWTVFMMNRLLRVLPVYYVAMLISLPTYYVGFTETGDHTDTVFTIESYVTNIIPSSTWFLYYLGEPFDVPAWTVQTLIGMWIFLPILLRFFHSKTDVELLQWIVYCFWIQLLIGIGLTYFALYVLSMGEWNAKCLGRLHPLSRIWVFMMGIATGILCLRYKKDTKMPWFDDAYWFFPLKSTFASVSSMDKSWWEAIHFKTLMFNQSFALVVVTLIIIAGDTVATYVYDIDSIGVGTWLQAILPFAQLNVMLAMVRHEDPENMVSRFLRSRFMHLLGELSMSIYLLHYPIMEFILWARYGFQSLTWPDSFDCSDYADDDDAYAVCENYYDALYWPRYCFLYLPVITVLVAYVIYYAIEKPFHSMKF